MFIKPNTMFRYMQRTLDVSNVHFALPQTLLHNPNTGDGHKPNSMCRFGRVPSRRAAKRAGHRGSRAEQEHLASRRRRRNQPCRIQPNSHRLHSAH